MTNNQIIKAIRKAFKKLEDQDGELFDLSIEETQYDARKLHEVCINHKLAIYLEEYLFPKIQDAKELYTDIEFNREGINFKRLHYEGQEAVVRPDIIIHNRRTGKQKRNFLVVECKKETASNNDKEEDVERIKTFMKVDKYQYTFGLQVIYGSHGVKGTLFFLNNNGNIDVKNINISNEIL